MAVNLAVPQICRQRRIGGMPNVESTRPCYEIVLYWSNEDQAVMPELPGCAADGQTNAEALDNVQVIIDQWIDTARKTGREIPKPRGRLTFA
jgi:predicted RNase H-like HicB family nuclease